MIIKKELEKRIDKIRIYNSACNAFKVAQNSAESNWHQLYGAEESVLPDELLIDDDDQ